MRTFYDAYSSFKDYETPTLKQKHIKRLDEELWIPARMDSGMSYLDLGCGTGMLLAYLSRKGVTSLLGIDFDAALAAVIPVEVQDCFRAGDIREYLANETTETFDRILLIDVIEHFSPEDGRDLLEKISPRLKTGGAIIIKVPNMASPWGAQFQYGDLTHLTAFTPGSMRQMALAAGLVVTSVWPHRLGSPSRRVLDRLFHGVLSRVVSSPPEIWDGNFYACLSIRG